MLSIGTVIVANGTGSYKDGDEPVDIDADLIWTEILGICNSSKYELYKYITHYMDRKITRDLPEGRYIYDINLSVVLEKT